MPYHIALCVLLLIFASVKTNAKANAEDTFNQKATIEKSEKISDHLTKNNIKMPSDKEKCLDFIIPKNHKKYGIYLIYSRGK